LVGGFEPGSFAASSVTSFLKPAATANKIDRLAGEAIDRLRGSCNTGSLQKSAYFAHRTGDSDLNDFRDRDDFKKLVTELVAKLPAAKPAAKT
jgi:hypothetical protein